MAFPENINICKFYWGGGFYNILNAPGGEVTTSILRWE